MTRTIRIDGALSLKTLERRLGEHEASIGRLSALDHRDGETLATFEEGEDAGGKLRLVLDPSGRASTPKGATLLCRGTVYVDGRPTGVAAFRSAAGRWSSWVAAATVAGVVAAAGALVGRNRKDSSDSADEPEPRARGSAKAAGGGRAKAAPAKGGKRPAAPGAKPKARGSGAGSMAGKGGEAGSAPAKPASPKGRAAPAPAAKAKARPAAPAEARSESPKRSKPVPRLRQPEAPAESGPPEDSAPDAGALKTRGGSPKRSKPVPRMQPPEAPTALQPPEAGEYRVWFGTNRKPVDPGDVSKGFSGARGGTTRYGHCDVHVPESHKIGSVGSSALRRLLTWTDDRLKLRKTAGLEREAYWASVAAQIAELEPGKRHAVVFIHGYNVSFEEAAIRAAQIGFDLGIGAMAFFSWPSKGAKTRRAYQSDGQTIGASEAAIADFLVDFARLSGAEAVHVIVHSMGNQGVARAVNAILADAERRGGCRFGQFILAAADVDAETFGRLSTAYRQLAARTTLYVSERDLALRASAWFADYPRVGLYPPVSVFDGIDTVSVSNVDLTLLGHGYVGEARDVLQDMHRLIFEGTAPPRFGLKERRNEAGEVYWEVGA